MNPTPDIDYILLFDPLDGSSNIDVNVSIGAIFSIPEKLHDLSSLLDVISNGPFKPEKINLLRAM